MVKQLKLLISISLTCSLVLCAGLSEARRVSPQQVESQYKVSPVMQQVQSIPKSRPVWQASIEDLGMWHQFSKPLRDYAFSKFVIDIKTGKVYFFDANVFNLHSDFVLGYLLKTPRTTANLKQYNRNYTRKKPQFILGYITHYPKLNEWAFSFWEGDTIDASTIASTAKKLKTTFKIADLKFRPDSSYQERVASKLKKWHVPVIKNKEIYRSMPYQSFNTGTAVGVLNIVPAGLSAEEMQFPQHDIVILQQVYPDISPVSGIITTKLSTPLSHVNLRAGAWNIPNAGLKTAAIDYAEYQGQWVHLAVTEQALKMRLATEDERQQRQQQEGKHVSLPIVDLQSKKMASLQHIGLDDVVQYGAKTTHLGAMRQAGLPVPNGFGLPFYYYQQHMKNHGLDRQLTILLEDARFAADPAWRRQQLLVLQQKIKAQPIDRQSFSAIKQQWKSVLGQASVFVRSSTNAEDLPGFNGAGLYDTVPNVKDGVALEAAVKQVWASLWNLRAVNERDFFGISHGQVYAAVLIQTGVDASASGVLLTTDIWGHQPETFTINAKWGLGMRVVAGEKIAEQVLYDASNHGTRIISRSDETSMLVFDEQGGIKEKRVPRSKAIITEWRAKQLGQLALKIEKLFPQYQVLDIEWLLAKTKQGRIKFYIVQARPYIGQY